jgi:DNA-binding MarR family transcriptional regulator
MSDTEQTEPSGMHEFESFQDSAFYWIGHLENLFNRELLQAVRPKRLTVARWRVLAVLVELSGLTVTELAGHTLIERTALIHVLKQMEAEGLVLRLANELDKRKVEVHIREAGRAEHAAILPVARSVYRKALSTISDEEIKHFIRTAKRMISSLKRSPYH